MRQNQITLLARKLMLIVVAVCAFFIFTPTALAIEGDTGSQGDFTWKELADGTVEVTGYTGNSSNNVTIPDTLSGKMVTAIGREAFFKCVNFGGKVTLPSTIKTIGSRAFSGCSNMTDINLPEGLTSIEWGAFSTCNTLKDVTFPSTLTDIGDSAFSSCDTFSSVTLKVGMNVGHNAFTGCDNLTSITIPEGMTTMGEGVFSCCTSLESITIPSTMTTIPIYTFSECSALKNVTLLSTLKVIGANAFWYCQALETFSIPQSVTTLGDSVFSNCMKLKDITIPKNVTSIGQQTFYYCPELKKVTILGSASIGTGAFKECPILDTVLIPKVTSIGNEAFQECTALGSITIPESVLTIGDNAFRKCTALESMTIPESVTTIGKGAFAQCKLIESIKIPSSISAISKYMFEECDALSDVQIPNTITSIGNGAFSQCQSLTQVALPNSVETIGEYAYACTGITSITLPSSVTSIGEGAFAECPYFDKATFLNSNVTFGPSVFEESPMSDGFYGFSSSTAQTYALDNSIAFHVLCTVLFNTDGGGNISAIHTLSGEKINTPANPTKEGFVFGGWFDTAACDGTKITFPYTVTGDATLYAKWIPICTISFDVQGGSSVAEQTVMQAAAIYAPTDPTKAGFVFSGWFDTAECDGTKISFPYTVTGDATLYAKWIPMCTISFDVQGGSSVAEQTVMQAAAIYAPTDPTKAGFVFGGWFNTAECNDTQITFPFTVANDATLYAKWEAVPPSEPTPTPSSKPNEKLITVTGKLVGDDGKPLAGYTVELHSTPRTAVTDAKGRYTFADVEISDHSLTVIDKNGATLKSFAIAVQTGDDFAWSKPDDENITAVVQDDTASIDVTIKLSKDGKVTIDKIENIVNPQTGDEHQLIYLWILCIAGALIICAMLIRKKCFYVKL